MAAPDPARRSERSRRAILAASVALVAERGYERTSVEAIAQRAGVGKQTIYRWWPSKGAVLLEALHERLQTIGDAEIVGRLEEDFRTRLTRIWQILGSTEVGLAYRGVIAAAQSDPDLRQATMQQVVEPAAAAIRQQVINAQQRREVREGCDPQAIVEVLNGAIYYRLLLDSRPFELSQIDSLLDVAFNGMRVGSSPSTEASSRRATPREIG